MGGNILRLPATAERESLVARSPKSLRPRACLPSALLWCGGGDELGLLPLAQAPRMANRQPTRWPHKIREHRSLGSSDLARAETRFRAISPMANPPKALAL